MPPVIAEYGSVFVEPVWGDDDDEKPEQSALLETPTQYEKPT